MQSHCININARTIGEKCDSRHDTVICSPTRLCGHDDRSKLRNLRLRKSQEKKRSQGHLGRPDQDDLNTQCTSSAALNSIETTSVTYAISPGSGDPFYIVTYYIIWVTPSWTRSISQAMVLEGGSEGANTVCPRNLNQNTKNFKR